MSAETNKQIAMKWFEAFNEHDTEKILTLYHDKAEHYSPKLKLRQPETNGLITGKEALRQWWNDSFTRLPSLKYEAIRLTADDEQVFMEYIRHVDGEEDLRVGEVLEIKNASLQHRQGLITASRVYHC